MVATSGYIDLVAELVLPLMSEAALFAKESNNEDRGKFFFHSRPTNDLAVIGNSFFRLLLECILVWGQRFADSQYSFFLNALRQ